MERTADEQQIERVIGDVISSVMTFHDPDDIRRCGAAVMEACEREAAERETMKAYAPAERRAWELEHDTVVMLRATAADWEAAGVSPAEAAERVARVEAGPPAADAEG